MWLQLVVIFIAFVYYRILESRGDTPQSRHKYVTVLIVMLILQSALRSVAVGADTFAYCEAFEGIEKTSWQEIIWKFHEVYIDKIGKDAGYDALQKAFYTVMPFFRVFLFVIAIGLFWPLYRLVEKYLPTLQMLFLSFCIYQALFYSFYSITGLRQVIATIATIVGIKFIQEKRIVPFCVIILIAATIHKSVLIFLPFFFIYYFSKSKTMLVAGLCAIPLLIPYARGYATILASYSGSDAYMQYAESDYETSGAQNFAIYIICTGLILYAAKKKHPEQVPDFIVNSTALALFFTPLTWVDPSLMRVVQYYSIFSLIGLPLGVYCLGGNKRLVLYVLMAALLFTVIRRGGDYAFFWQAMELGANYK